MSRAIKEEFPINSSGGMQAFAFNTRRDKFSDPRVRRAFNYALNFEDLNKQLFFGQYKRVEQLLRRHWSWRPAACREGEELAILETVRDKVPPRGVHHGLQQSGQRHGREVRANLREATRLAARRRLRSPQSEARQRQDRRSR